MGWMALQIFTRLEDDIGDNTLGRGANAEAIAELQRDFAVMENARSIAQVSDRRWQTEMSNKVDRIDPNVTDLAQEMSSYSATLNAMQRQADREAGR